MAFVHSLGADAIIDYTQTDVTQQNQRYDLVLDAAAYRSPLRYLRILRSTGVYVLVGGATSRLFQTLLMAPVLSMIGGKSLNTVMAKPNPEDLSTLTELIEEGRVAPAIDRCFPLSEVPDAIRYVEDGRAQGKVVITV
jgi:NADPH:quinone reductase-like Zn-dependent oxidoreductase